MVKVIGVDPGLRGAIATYAGTEDSLFVYEMPKIKIRKHGDDIDWDAVIDMLDLCICPADHLFIELVGAMPEEGPSGAFKFGNVCGEISGVLRQYRIPRTMVPASVWKPAMRVTAAKMTSVIRAMELFPNHTSLFKGPRGGYKDGAAEATLIAVYGHTLLTGGFPKPASKPPTKTAVAKKAPARKPSAKKAGRRRKKAC